MRLSHRQACSSLHVPPAQYPIAASTHQQVSTLTPGESKHDPGMPAQGLYAFCALRVPYEQLSAACAPTGQPHPIRTPGRAGDHATVSQQLPEQRALGGLPQADAPIIATTGEPRAIRTPGYTADFGRV